MGLADIPVRNFSAPQTLAVDMPRTEEKPQLLYTLAYSELIEALADTFFPPNTIKTGDGELVIKTSALRVDRHIHFRAAWQPEFGAKLQLALRDVTSASVQATGRHFAALDAITQDRLLAKLVRGELSSTEWTSLRAQKDAFATIHDAISCGVLADPGYGGNREGLGWVYAQFTEYGE